MPFCVNGSAASLAPYSQEWGDAVMGHDHLGAPVLSAYKTVTLVFDSCPSQLYQQWSQFVSTGTSVVSVNILNQDQTSFIAVSGAFLEWDRRPRLEAGVVMGPWSVLVTNIIPA